MIIRYALELTPRQQTIFILRDVHHLTVEEIVQIVPMKKSGIKANLYHARRKLKGKMDQILTQGRQP